MKPKRYDKTVSYGVPGEICQMMQHLRLDDTAFRGVPRAPVDIQVPGSLYQQNLQLPPQMFTTAAQLLDMTDSDTEKLMVSLRDGRKLIGTLRSWDQFANLVLQSTVERIYVPPTSKVSISSLTDTICQPGLFADIPRGVFLVRGENVVLLGEIDLDKDDDIPSGYELADIETVQRIVKERKIMKAARRKIRLEKLRKLGFEDEITAEMSI